MTTDRIDVADPWGKRVSVPLHSDTYGDTLYVAGYTIAWGALAIMANSWEDAWEVWLEQQRPADLDADEIAALEAGEMIEGLEWADGVGYVVTEDLSLSGPIGVWGLSALEQQRPL